MDIAMGVLEDMGTPGVSIPSKQSLPSVPDISNVKVSDDYISLIIEGSSPESKLEAPTKIEEVSNEDKVRDLVYRLSALLNEAKTLLTEMTTTGMLGTKTVKDKKFNKGAKKDWEVRHGASQVDSGKVSSHGSVSDISSKHGEMAGLKHASRMLRKPTAVKPNKYGAIARVIKTGRNKK